MKLEPSDGSPKDPLDYLLDSGRFKRDGFNSFNEDLLEMLVPDRFRELAREDGYEVEVNIVGQRSPDVLHFELTAYDMWITVKLRIPNFTNIVEGDIGVSVCVDDFDHSDYIRGIGITTQFYFKLEDMLRKLGFLYYYGDNYPRNIGFFLNNLGRNRMAELPDDTVLLICGSVSKAAIRNMTYKSL